jgi:hypothetical protein
MWADTMALAVGEAPLAASLVEILSAFGLLMAGVYFLLLPRSLRQVAALPWLGAALAARALVLVLGLWRVFGTDAAAVEWLVPAMVVVGRLQVGALAEFAAAITGRRTPWWVHAAAVAVVLGAAFERMEPRLAWGALGPLWLAMALLIPARRATAEARLLVWPMAAWTVAASWGLAAGAAGAPVMLGAVRVQVGDLLLMAMVPLVLALLLRRTEVQQTERRQLLDEMEAARQVQEMLVPAMRVRTPGYRIQSAYQPMAEVGGDFFQLFETPGQGVLLVAGDVSGKGLRAAMLVSMIVGILGQRRNDEPAQVLAELNRGLAGRVGGGFVTAFAALFTPDGRVRIANAGHLPPYRNGADLTVESGLPLGMMAVGEWEETALQLEQNDRLVFLSDGVAEARNAAGELLGFERARELSYRPASEIARAAEKWGQSDDITVIAVTHDRGATQAAGA